MARKKVVESTAVPVIESEVVRDDPVERSLSPQERINLCNVAIGEALKTYNCELMVSTLLEPPNVVRPIIRIIPKA